MQGRPPRQKAPVTSRPPITNYFDPYTSQADSDGDPKTLDDRPAFVVPHGKRRHRQAPGRTNLSEKTVREKQSTYRGSPTTKAALARNVWAGRTTSPTGRGHPNRDRRNDVRKADLHADIDYFATQRDSHSGGASTDPSYVAPNNDLKMKEASWLASQASDRP